jgi:hypothetical protein
MNQRVPTVPTVPTQKSITPMRNVWPMAAAHCGWLGAAAMGTPPSRYSRSKFEGGCFRP